MRIYFIVHGSSQIGMGHIMRCIALADGFRSRGHNACFFSRYAQGADYIKQSGFPVIALPGDQRDTEGYYYGQLEDLNKDKEIIEGTLDGFKVDVLVLDSYNVTQAYMKSLKTMTSCLVYIDDLAKFKYPVDLLINGTASSWRLDYRNQDKKTILLLGLKYNILRREFCQGRKKELSDKVHNILVTTGGSDPHHMTEKILDFLSKEPWFSEKHIYIIVGTGFSDSIFYDSLIRTNINIHLLQSPSKMSDIMLQCDVAIAAGGTTIYELASCGIPMAVFCYAENQIEQVKQLEKEGLLVNLGHYSEYNKILYQKLFKRLMDTPLLRKDMARAFGRLIDGMGVERIVENIETKLIEVHK